jgi:hypothetical protein
MIRIRTGKLPENALSAQYADDGAYADCYHIDIPRQIALEEYIQAFYTTPLFKVERAILSLVARKSSRDSEVDELSSGRSKRFSIWTVESRLPSQILLCDFTNKTRSWLMVASVENGETPSTRLYFGSVVVPRAVSENGQGSFGVLFYLLSGIHCLYSRALLKSAFAKLARKRSGV